MVWRVFSSHIWHNRGILLQFSGAFQNCDSSPKQGRSQKWPRKPFTSTNLSKTLSICFTHRGPFLIFTISDHGEGGNKKSVFMRTSLWNVTVFENYLRLQVKCIWILNYLLSGRKKTHYWNIYLERKPMYFKIYISNWQTILISLTPSFSLFPCHNSDACQYQLLDAFYLFLAPPFLFSPTLLLCCQRTQTYICAFNLYTVCHTVSV